MKEIPENYKKQLLSPFLSTENNMVKITARVKDSEKINRKELIDNIRNHLNNNYNSIEEIKLQNFPLFVFSPHKLASHPAWTS